MTSGEAPVPDGGSTASAAGPPAFDTSVASQARMYDYLLGGKDNYAADREAVEDAVPSGSYLALTHLASDLLGQDAQDGLEDVNAQKMRMRFTSRDREQVARFFEGTELVEPGLVRVEDRAGRAGPGRHRPRQGQPGLRAADRARHRDRPAGPAGRGGVTDGGRGADAGTRRSRSPARPGTVAGLEAASFGAFLDVRLARPAQASR
jgi:hypothetical protein